MNYLFRKHGDVFYDERRNSLGIEQSMYTALNAKTGFGAKPMQWKGNTYVDFLSACVSYVSYDRDARLLKNGIEIVIKTSKILLFILILFIILISFMLILFMLVFERLLDAFYLY